jgi:hypothetical protein
VGISKEDLEKFEKQIASKFRFAVEAEGGRSSRAWRIWSKKDDIYLASAGIGGKLKFSLHSKGYCQLAMTSEHFKSLPPTVQAKIPNRVLEHWQRPATPKRGAIHVFSLLFPTDFFTGPKLTGSPGKLLTLFSAAPAGHALEFGLFYSLEDPKLLSERLAKVGTPLLSVSLPGGEHVSIVVRNQKFDGKPLREERRISSGVRPLGGTLDSLAKGQTLLDLTALVALSCTSEARIFAELSGVSLTKN